MTTPSVDRPVSVEPMTDDDFAAMQREIARTARAGGIRKDRATWSDWLVASLAARCAGLTVSLPLPRRYTGGPLEDGLYLWRTMYWPNHRWVAEPSRADVEAVVNRFSIIWLIGPITIPDIPSKEASS